MKNQSIKVDTAAFTRALNNLELVSKRTLAEQCNQRAMNVARRCVEEMPPHDVPAARAKVKRYMDEILSQRVRQTKKGRFVKSGKKKNQFSRKNLIAQMRNAKAGKKGLYGEAMRKASGRLSRMAQVSQGFLKSVFIPVIVGLYPHVKYRPKASLTRNISRWSKSAGDGKVTPARDGFNPIAVMKIGAKAKRQKDGSVKSFYEKYIRKAINDETIEMERHFDKQLEKELGLG